MATLLASAATLVLDRQADTDEDRDDVLPHPRQGRSLLQRDTSDHGSPKTTFAMRYVDAMWMVRQREDVAVSNLSSSPSCPGIGPLSSPSSGQDEATGNATVDCTTYHATYAGFIPVSDFSRVLAAYPIARRVEAKSVVVPLSKNGGQFCIRVTKRAGTGMMGCGATGTGTASTSPSGSGCFKRARHGPVTPTVQSPPSFELEPTAVFSAIDRENRAATLRRYVRDLPVDFAPTALLLMQHTNNLAVVPCMHCDNPTCLGWKVAVK